ncbi:MAG: response regulator [Acidimicrobiia bacterium]|nr:response regulator [Acidimicrobiia bacterium]
MNESRRPATILMADDDPDDRQLAADALAASRLANPLHFVNDGEELIEYLRGTGRYADNAPARPALILLDLNMPKMDGREALEVIKADPSLRTIPVVVLTTSAEERDIVTSYELGVAGYVSKPVSFLGLVDVMRGIGDYWFEIVRLPGGK